MNWVKMNFIKQHLAALQKNRVTRNMFQRTNSLSLFDQVDSDFSFSETDEIIEQDDEDEGKKKRKKTFYKKPVRPKADEKEIKARQKAPTEKIKKDKAAVELRASSRKSTRAATVRSSDKHKKRMEGKKVDLPMFV